jgi:hypothetical protein
MVVYQTRKNIAIFSPFLQIVFAGTYCHFAIQLDTFHDCEPPISFRGIIDLVLKAHKSRVLGHLNKHDGYGPNSWNISPLQRIDNSGIVKVKMATTVVATGATLNQKTAVGPL